MTYCIGLTGTMASGKSTVSEQFHSLGIEIINADQIAKAIVEPGQPALQKIIDHLGKSILTPEKYLDRRLLRELIVQNDELRLWLEGLLHPIIRKQIENDLALCQSPYCIIEIPILINKSPYPYLNKILLVTANEKIQIARLMARDDCNQEQARAILATSAAHETLRRSIADDILENNTSISELKSQISHLHRYYLNQAQAIKNTTV